MVVNEMEPYKLYLPLIQQKVGNLELRPQTSEKFSDTINDLIKNVDSLSKESNAMNESFIKGEPVDIHDVMIAAEKSKTSFQLLMELRNKFLDTYKELSRTQV